MILDPSTRSTSSSMALSINDMMNGVGTMKIKDPPKEVDGETVAMSDASDMDQDENIMQEHRDDVRPESPPLHRGHHRSDTVISNNNPLEMIDFSQVSVDVDDLEPLIMEETSPACTRIPSTSVRFGSIDVREYARDLGDNPSVRSGAPISLSWHVQAEFSLELDAYERHRPPRRTRDQLQTEPLLRRQWLQHAGYSHDQITAAIKTVNRIKYSRLRTNTTSTKLHQAGEVPRRLVKGLLNASIRRTQKQLERRQLESALDQQRRNRRFSDNDKNKNKNTNTKQLFRPKRTKTM